MIQAPLKKGYGMYDSKILSETGLKIVQDSLKKVENKMDLENRKFIHWFCKKQTYNVIIFCNVELSVKQGFIRHLLHSK